MELEKYLVLNKYFLNFFGFEEFDGLRGRLNRTEEGYDSDGRSYFFHVLRGLKSDFEDKLRQYDDAIREYVNRLSSNRGEAIRLKYFQYLAILFTEMFLERYYRDRTQFLKDLNNFLEIYTEKNKIQFNEKNKQLSPFTENDLKKLAFWMATGSGKTLIMHINYWQILNWKKDWNNVILVTPNEGLSQQHCEELKKSGIPCKLYDGNNDNLKTNDGEILIIDIYKLTGKKEGGGVRVDVSYFGNNNLVFVDEGHKGQKTEEQTWKNLREDLAKDGFIFEYSATFEQVIGNDEALLKEYAKAIIMDYSYKYFYDDGYGKDFYVYNIKEHLNSDSTEEQERLLLTAGLLSFYEQLHAFEENKEELRDYKIEKPLWVFVGSKVSGKGINSDIVKVIMFLDKILKDEKYLKNNIIRILEGRSGFVDSDGRDIFKDKFNLLKDIDIYTLVSDIYSKIFGGRGTLEIKEIKNAEGEIGLRTSSGGYFGVVNVGNITDLKNLLKITELELNIKEDDNFQKSLFDSINKPTSSINILIGSKKFLEGWNSYRVSTMCLLNMGKNEGAQVIQLFGRGVRLKGKNSSLKREKDPDDYLKVLQTLSIIGLNANYMETFIKYLQKEGVDYANIKIPIKFNQLNKWNGKIYTIKISDDFKFLNFPITLHEDEGILNEIEIKSTPKITITRNLKVENVVSEIKDPIKIPNKYFDLIDWNEIYREIINYKVNNGMYNLCIDLNVIRKIILKSENYKIFMSPTEGIDIDMSSGRPELKITSFTEIEVLKKIVLEVIERYIDKFYYKKGREESMEHLVPEPLTDKDSSMFPYDKKIILKVPKNFKDEIGDIMSEVEKIKKSNFAQLNEDYFIHFENHLYTPLVISKREEIKSTPVALNEGESKFIKNFKDYLNNNKDLFKKLDVFILRNLSRRGIGFFFKEGFYPDFIIWISKKDEQDIIFVDPKGLTFVKNVNDPKIKELHDIEEMGNKLNEKLNRNNFKLQLYAFILSVTPYNDVKNAFGEGGYTKEDFEKNNIFFQEDSDYIANMLKKAGIKF